SAVPTGLIILLSTAPAMNRWAILMMSLRDNLKNVQTSGVGAKPLNVRGLLTIFIGAHDLVRGPHHLA
ncbi:MAG: hypothetical protein ACRD68_13945, partial [Pyrinomonadaceae bacterium]